MSMSEWKLSELTIDGKGSYGIAASAVDYDPQKPTYLRITDINDDGTINFDGLKSVDDENSDKFVLKENDIVFARTGASTGRSYFYQKEDGTFVYAGFLIKFSLNPEKVNPRYLKYYTHSKVYYDWVHSFDSGATRGNINAKTFGDMIIELPERRCQDRIVFLLKDLDDKIAVNRRICENLEAQAQALFKHWFIDFAPFKDGKFIETELGMIPEGWRVGTLGEIANITMGQSPVGSSYNEIGDGIVFYQGRTEFGFRFPGIRLYTTEPKRFADPLSTLLSVRAPVGDLNIATERCCIGRGLASISSKYSAHSYIYYLLLSMNKIFNVYNGEGTVFGCINKDTLNGLRIIISPFEVIQRFEDVVKELDNKIFEAYQENLRLSTLRDTLLPKLMSGQIKL